MGFEFVKNQKMSDGFKIISSEDSTWEQPWGEFKFIKDQHTKLTVHLQETSGEKRLIDIIFKVFNDGLGFRYYFPKQLNLTEVEISNELQSLLFLQNMMFGGFLFIQKIVITKVYIEKLQ